MHLTEGPNTTKIIQFLLPPMSGNLLQQMYNIPTHGWQVAFFREITLIDNGLTDDPEKFVAEIRIPVQRIWEA